MPNPIYGPKGYSNKDIDLEKGKESVTPGNRGGKRMDATGQRGAKDYPMKLGTADWKNPAGWKEQPRDRSWGMREADGFAFDDGLVGPDVKETPESNETYVKR